jgi:AcrR family transcriptional regulator
VSVVQRRRGRKPNPEIEANILAATRDVLLENGHTNFTISAVVALAGVSTASIYKRWSTAEALIVAALSEVAPDTTEINTGSLEEDLSAFIDYFGGSLLSFEGFVQADRRDSRMDPGLRKQIRTMFTEPRKKLLRKILESAGKRGELFAVPTTEHCWDYIVAPIYYRLCIRREPFTPEFATEAKSVALATLQTLGRPAL